MKVGIFDPYLDTLGGGEKYILTTASCLSKNNDVTLFWNNEEIVKRGEKKFQIDLKKIKVSPNIFGNQFSSKKRFLSSKHFDAIFYLSDGSLPLVWSKLFVHFQFPVKRQKENELLRKTKISRISKVICNSYYTKKYIDKEFGVKSVVLYPPVEDVKSDKEFEKENLIITVGRFNRLPDGKSFKKHEFLIEAFKKLPKNEYKFIIVTSKEKNGEQNIEKLRKMIKGYPITITEDLSKKELDVLYLKAKVYWHASGFGEDLENFPERAEHFGISTVEAMLAGAVPVVIKAGGQEEILIDRESGFLFNSEKELLDNTKLLMTDNNLWEKMANKAKERGKLFSGNRFCNELIEIIK